MKPLYAARLEDLGPDDYVRVECACGHEALLLAEWLIRNAGLSPDQQVLKLERKFRCRECDRKGSASVMIRWHIAPS
jgi:hypothetical protein